MYFFNLSNGFWFKKFFKWECLHFVRFQSNHLQWVKYFDFWDYDLVFSILIWKTYIFDWTIWSKPLSDWLKQFLIWYILFLFTFRKKIWFSKKEFLNDRKKFKKFLIDRIIFLSDVSDSYKWKIISSIIDYVYNFFDIRSNIKIQNKEFFLKYLDDFRKYFWGDKWTLWWSEWKFDLNYKIYIFSENREKFFKKFDFIKQKLPERFLFLWTAKNFILDDKQILII